MYPPIASQATTVEGRGYEFQACVLAIYLAAVAEAPATRRDELLAIAPVLLQWHQGNPSALKELLLPLIIDEEASQLVPARRDLRAGVGVLLNAVLQESWSLLPGAAAALQQESDAFADYGNRIAAR